MVVVFRAGAIFQGFVGISIFEIQHETKIHPLTGLEIDWKIALLVSIVSATIHFGFILDSIPFMFLLYAFISFHSPLIFLSCSFQSVCDSCRFSFICQHVPFISHSCPFVSVHSLSKVMDMGLWLGQATGYNKWLSLSDRYNDRLITPTLKHIVRRKFSTKPQR